MSEAVDQHRHPVIVVGGGLGGSAAAAFLARAGVDTVVLERHESPTARPRAWVISARSVELFQQLDLGDAVRDAGTPGTWSLDVVSSLQDAPDKPVPSDATADVSPTGAVICDQDVVEDLLRRYAAGRGAAVRFGEQVVDVIDRGSHVEMHRERGEPLVASYVVLAEGARAELLGRLGVALTDRHPDPFDEYDQVLFRSAELDELTARTTTRAFVIESSGNIVFRRDLGRWQLQQNGRRIDDVEAAIAHAVGRTVAAEILDHSSWRPAARLADRFRVGNVFVIGDAAHSMPPSLGMGGNLSIDDAFNLAWKLAWVLTGRAAPSLLDSFEAERRPVDEYVLEQSIAAMEQAAGGSRPDPVTVQLGLVYPSARSGALDGDRDDLGITDPRDLTPTVGARLPHQWLPDGRSTVELATIDTFAVVGANPPFDLVVPSHRWPGAAPQDDRVWLVRPDGIVAAHVHPDHLDETLRSVLGH